MRQAVAWAIDRTQIRDVAYFGRRRGGHRGGADRLALVRRRRRRSARPGQGQGAARSRPGSANGLTIEYLGLPQYPELLKTGEVVREQLKQIGIDMDIEQVDVSVWFDRFVKGDYQITSAYQERTIDPDNFYALVVRSGGAINTTAYSNPDVDALIDEAADRDRRGRAQGALPTDPPDRVRRRADHLRALRDDQLPDEQRRHRARRVNPTLELRLENVGFTG